MRPRFPTPQTPPPQSIPRYRDPTSPSTIPPTLLASPTLSIPAPHLHPGNTTVPTYQQASGQPPTHLHAGKNRPDQVARSACSDRSQSQAILPLSHSLPFTRPLPVAHATTPLAASGDNRGTRNHCSWLFSTRNTTLSVYQTRTLNWLASCSRRFLNPKIVHVTPIY
jgi:hypothetical protein